MATVVLTVIVYRAEAFYFAHMAAWQSGMVAPLTRKYWRRTFASDDGSDFYFAPDDAVAEFWEDLDATRLNERFTIDADPRSSVDEFSTRAMHTAQTSPDARLFRGERLQGIYHLESGVRLEEGKRLTDYSFEDGDHAGMIIEHNPHACYCLLPLPDSETVFAAIRSSNEQPPAIGAEALSAALLYTDEDVEIATYVRKHFASLSEASGPNLHVYVIEQPEADWREASRYWKGILSDRLQREWATLGWLRTKPYKAEDAYAVARRLNVYPDELPCLVLFDRLESPDRLVFPVLDGSALFFRGLFSRLQRLILPEQSKELSFDGVRRNFDSIMQSLRESVPEAQQPDRIVYQFEGQTVFINKPSGPVELSDFQNRPDKKGNQP